MDRPRKKARRFTNPFTSERSIELNTEFSSGALELILSMETEVKNSCIIRGNWSNHLAYYYYYNLYGSCGLLLDVYVTR